MAAGFVEGAGKSFWSFGQKGVADGGAVAAGVNGVHDSESAADAEGEAEEEPDESCAEGHSFIMSRVAFWNSVEGPYCLSSSE